MQVRIERDRNWTVKPPIRRPRNWHQALEHNGTCFYLMQFLVHVRCGPTYWWMDGWLRGETSSTPLYNEPPVGFVCHLVYAPFCKTGCFQWMHRENSVIAWWIIITHLLSILPPSNESIPNTSDNLLSRVTSISSMSGQLYRRWNPRNDGEAD